MSAVTVVGSCSVDFIVEVAVFPGPGETVLGGDVITEPGGKGANQAVAARRLGLETTFVGAIGDDEFGNRLREALTREGIDLRRAVTVKRPTGVALVTVDGTANNTITVAPGANHSLSPSHMMALKDVVTSTSVLLLQLEVPLATNIAAAIAAREVGARVLLNAAPLVDATDASLGRLLQLTDVLIVNENEARALGPSHSIAAHRGWEDRAAELRSRGPDQVVITLGEAGAAVAERGTSYTVSSHVVKAVDSTGAGDAFCGAVAASLCNKRSLRDAVEIGCAAGALATTKIGAQTALPTMVQIQQLLSSGGPVEGARRAGGVHGPDK